MDQRCRIGRRRVGVLLFAHNYNANLFPLLSFQYWVSHKRWADVVSIPQFVDPSHMWGFGSFPNSLCNPNRPQPVSIAQGKQPRRWHSKGTEFIHLVFGNLIPNHKNRDVEFCSILFPFPSSGVSFKSCESVGTRLWWPTVCSWSLVICHLSWRKVCDRLCGWVD